MFTGQPSTRTLATTTVTTVAVFPAIVIALNLAQLPGYHAGRQAVSDLALGRGGWLMAIAFGSLGIGTLALGALIRRTTAKAAVRAALLTLAGLLSFVSAAFHTDPTGASATVHGRIHNAAGIVTFLAMLATMAISARRFRQEAAWRSFATPTALLTGLGAVAFFLVPGLGTAHFGIAQRLLIGSFVLWTLAAAVHIRRAADGARFSMAIASS